MGNSLGLMSRTEKMTAAGHRPLRTASAVRSTWVRSPR